MNIERLVNRMEDSNKREVMREAYQLLEKHENPSSDVAFWEALYDDCNSFVSRWKGIYLHYALELAVSIANALEKEYKQLAGEQA
jgi:hypothetical protein